MRKWRRYLDEFVLECDCKDVTLIKICACMFGVMLGMRVPQQRKKAAAAVSAAVFLTTTGLMAYRLIRQCCNLLQHRCKRVRVGSAAICRKKRRKKKRTKDLSCGLWKKNKETKGGTSKKR